MDAIAIALRKTMERIPPDILELAFEQDIKRGMVVDVAIHDNIIVKSVVPDCNLYSGHVKPIRLKSSYRESVTGRDSYDETAVFRIPPDEREGKPITSVISVRPDATYASSGYPVHDLFQAGGHTAMQRGFGALTVETGRAYSDSAPTVQLKSNDIITLYPGANYDGWVAYCRLAWDTTMHQLNNDAIDTFSQLVIFATKRYIYNTLYLRVERGMIASGTPLSVLQNLISEYSDSDERYREALLEFRGATMFDDSTRRALFRLQI